MNPLQLVLSTHPHLTPKMVSRMEGQTTFAELRKLYRSVNFDLILTSIQNEVQAREVLTLIKNEISEIKGALERKHAQSFTRLQFMIKSGALMELFQSLEDTDQHVVNYFMSPFFDDRERLAVMHFWKDETFYDFFCQLYTKFPVVVAKLVIRCISLMMFYYQHETKNFTQLGELTGKFLSIVEPSLLQGRAIPYLNEEDGENWSFLTAENFSVHREFLRYGMITPLYVYRSALMSGKPAWLSEYLDLAKQTDRPLLLAYLNHSSPLYRLPNGKKSSVQLCIRSLVMEYAVEADPTLSLEIKDFSKRKVAPEKENNGWHEQMIRLAGAS